MEYLTPTVSFNMSMDNCFTSFDLLTHHEVNNIGATGVLNKKRLRKCTSIGDKQLQKKKKKKKERDHIEQRSAHLAKKQVFVNRTD